MLGNLFTTMTIKNSKKGASSITPNFVLMTMRVFHISSVLAIFIL
jgi:hypothetical protein